MMGEAVRMNQYAWTSAQELGELNYEGAYFSSYMLPVTNIPRQF